MNRSGFALVLVFAITTSAWLPHASAATPTVTPSPGYDARLQEEHAQRNAMPQPAGASAGLAVRHHGKKKPHHPAH